MLQNENFNTRMSDVESDEGPPPHPATYELPDIPFDEMSPLQKRWHKIKAIPEFPVKVVYLGDCEMPLEYVEYLSEDMRKQALEVFYPFLHLLLNKKSSKRQQKTSTLAVLKSKNLAERRSHNHVAAAAL